MTTSTKKFSEFISQDDEGNIRMRLGHSTYFEKGRHTPAQISLNKALEDLDNWKQSCEEAVYASDLNHLTETLKLDKEHTYYQNMRQAMLARAKVLGCTFDIPRDTWMEPPEFNGISEAQRDELQDLLAQNRISKSIFQLVAECVLNLQNCLMFI